MPPGRVRCSHRANQGAAAARNKAFSLCQGDYIQWLDGDDLLSADKITMQMAAVSRGCNRRTLLSSGWGAFMYGAQRAEFRPTPLWCDLTPAEFLIRKLGQNLRMQPATWLVSRELTEAAGPWSTKLLGDDDGEYFCRVLLASDGVRFVSEGRVFYRVAGSQRLSYIGRSSRKMEAMLPSMRLHIDYLRSLEDSERSQVACGVVGGAIVDDDQLVVSVCVSQHGFDGADDELAPIERRDDDGDGARHQLERSTLALRHAVTEALSSTVSNASLGADKRG